MEEKIHISKLQLPNNRLNIKIHPLNIYRYHAKLLFKLFKWYKFC